MLRDKLSLALIAGIVMAICGIMVFSEASIVKAVGTETTIHIVGKVADTAVTTITFPEGAPSATVSNPYNNVDTDTNPQVLSSSSSEPVVRLKNTSAGTLTVWLEITAWTAAVASEDYELVTAGTATVDVVGNVLSADGGAVASFSTDVTIGAGLYKDLYLEVTLNNQYGKSGTSTLTILGESL